MDPLYPEILASEAVTVVPGAGPTGENVLDMHAVDYVVAGVAPGDFGSVPGGFGRSFWDASEGCLSAQYRWTTTAWNQSYYNPLLVASGSLFLFDAGFELSADLLDRTLTNGKLLLGTLGSILCRRGFCR